VTETDGDVVGPLRVGPVAHGGHCVARHEGRVIFVRHSLPGELVRARVTDTSHARFWRADAVEVLQASADRVQPPCPIAGPGLCGGCDFQHATLDAQRRLKTAVVAEQLRRLAGIDWQGGVEDVSTPATRDGLGWRTRMRYAVDADGVPGLRAFRSHRLVPLPEGGCRIASPATVRVENSRFPPGVELVTSPGTLLVDARVTVGDTTAWESAAGRRWQVPADGFWQVHPAAADILVAAVLEGLRPASGERALDLYCGVGLFTGALADAGCTVWGVEASRPAVEAAGYNLRDVADRVHLVAARVERAVPRLPRRTDLAVLDPPRTGAGRRVLSELLRRRPRAVAYVACDPAALARDLALAAGLGYVPSSVRAFDLFPMTHHVECVAILEQVAEGVLLSSRE
jgi:tRNA/tmRNA/rRNA uracil-C5-methylase (TrmA/RlmC/RlmD family)